MIEATALMINHPAKRSLFLAKSGRIRSDRSSLVFAS
jgi:hypothetical protein